MSILLCELNAAKNTKDWIQFVTQFTLIKFIYRLQINVNGLKYWKLITPDYAQIFDFPGLITLSTH